MSLGWMALYGAIALAAFVLYAMGQGMVFPLG